MARTFRSPREFDDERLRPGSREFRCQICQERYPIRLMKWEDGARVCTVNCDSVKTRTQRDEERARAHKIAAEKTAASKPSPFPPGSTISECAFLETISWSGGEWPYQPVELRAGGAAVPVTLTGQNFTESNVELSYDSGISDASAPSVDSSTTVTLSLQAEAGMAPGYYDLTFGLNPWRRVLRVKP